MARHKIVSIDLDPITGPTVMLEDGNELKVDACEIELVKGTASNFARYHLVGQFKIKLEGEVP